MIFGLVLVFHILVCFALIGVVLLQSGRGGLSEALGGAGAQSLFGGGAATILTRITAVCASIFVVTCLSLAYLSTVRGRSLIEQVPVVAPETLPLTPGTEPFGFPLPGAPAPATPADVQDTEEALQPPEVQTDGSSGTTLGE